MIEKIAIKDRQQWLKLRERDVTASVAGALFGVHEYQTPLGLWALKSGTLSDDVEETPPMRRGRLLEPVALQLLAEEKPMWKITPGNVEYYRDPVARIGATPDCFAVDPNRAGFGIIQVKTCEPMIFRKKWVAEDGLIEPPLWIGVQAAVEMYLTGASWACVAAMTVSHGLTLHLVEIPTVPGLIETLKEKVSEFWKMVETNTPPDPDYGQDGALIARLYANDDGSSVDLSADNMLPELLDERASLKDQIKASEDRCKAIDTEVRDKLGEATFGSLPGWSISCKTIQRKAYEVKATSYRQLRITGEKIKCQKQPSPFRQRPGQDTISRRRCRRGWLLTTPVWSKMSRRWRNAPMRSPASSMTTPSKARSAISSRM